MSTDPTRFPFLSVHVQLGFTGGVGGTKRNCEELMKDGQPLLFFPGGIAESFKARATPPYSLLWGDRLGFVHMAIKHGWVE